MGVYTWQDEDIPLDLLDLTSGEEEKERGKERERREKKKVERESPPSL